MCTYSMPEIMRSYCSHHGTWCRVLARAICSSSLLSAAPDDLARADVSVIVLCKLDIEKCRHSSGCRSQDVVNEGAVESWWMCWSITSR